MTPNKARRAMSIAADARKAGKYVMVSELPHDVDRYLERIAVGRQRPIVDGQWGWHSSDIIDILGDYIDANSDT